MLRQINRLISARNTESEVTYPKEHPRNCLCAEWIAAPTELGRNVSVIGRRNSIALYNVEARSPRHLDICDGNLKVYLERRQSVNATQPTNADPTRDGGLLSTNRNEDQKNLWMVTRKQGMFINATDRDAAIDLASTLLNEGVELHETLDATRLRERKQYRSANSPE